MIKLRKLTIDDIPYMIEWMSDEKLTEHLKTNFMDYANYDSQKKFIENAINEHNINFAIADYESNEYLGSISLKDINYENKEAEYAICIRRCAQGKGIAEDATNEILLYAFSVLKLERLFLYVQTRNERANGFYHKYGFDFDGTKKKSMEIKGEMCDINWYSITKEKFFELFKSREKEMTNVKKVSYKENTDHRGELVAIENPKNLPFELNRVYYMYNVDVDVIRGKHSHYDLEQILICVSGSVEILTKTPFEEKKYLLNTRNEGLYIGNMIWREMYYFSDDAVLLVLASKKYDENDYIREYDKYLVEANNYFIEKAKEKVKKMEN